MILFSLINAMYHTVLHALMIITVHLAYQVGVQYLEDAMTIYMMNVNMLMAVKYVWATKIL